jgi:hypothetical protein
MDFTPTETGLTDGAELSKEDYLKKSFIMKAVIRSSRLMSSVGDRIEKCHLFKEFPDLQFIWDSIYGYFKVYHHNVSLSNLDLDLNCRMTRPDHPIEFSRSDLQPLLDEAEAIKDVQEAPIVDLLSAYFKQAGLSALRTRLETGEEIDLSALQTASESFKTAVLKPRDKNPFRDLDKYLVSMPRIPLGIPFYDKMLKGGTLPGEVTGMIMPTKGGKTTFCCQGVRERVHREEHVAVFSFEQSLEGDLTKRLCVLATHSARSDWENLEKRTSLHPEIQARLEKAMPLWKKYLHVYDDWVQHDMPLYSPKDLFNIVEDMDKAGEKPRFIFIDWWGEMYRKLLATTNFKSDFDKRMKSQEWLHEIHALAEKYQVHVIMFHQMSGDESKKSHGGHIGTAHDAQENKNFPNMMDFCFVTTRPNSEDQLIMKLDVARSAGQSQVNLKLDGEHCEFKPVDMDYSAELMAKKVSTPTDQYKDVER